MIRIEEKRSKLVTHIASKGITDASVLEAIRRVPRHEFVPPSMKNRAYKDIPLPIGHAQTISQPSLVALMTQLLKLTNEKTVLEIGTGSGYQAAILSLLSKHVHTIERIPSLAKKAAKTLRRMGYTNIDVITANGTIGLPDHAPYDAIIVTAGSPNIPDALVEQLAEEGRIAIPVGPEKESQELVVGIKRDGELIQRGVETVRFVPLIGENGWQN